jgi:hypothetical protein
MAHSNASAAGQWASSSRFFSNKSGGDFGRTHTLVDSIDETRARFSTRSSRVFVSENARTHAAPLAQLVHGTAVAPSPVGEEARCV